MDDNGIKVKTMEYTASRKNTFIAKVNLEIKIPGTVLKKIFLIFQIFCGIIWLRMKYSKKKHSQVKILQKLRILPHQNVVAVDFFLSIKFYIKIILTTIESYNLQRILCNIM